MKNKIRGFARTLISRTWPCHALKVHPANKCSGFTLIEVLMVVAIIGILATVVLGQVTAARARAANVVIKSTLSNLRTQAALVYSSANPDSYAQACTDPIFVAGLTNAGTIGGEPAKCFAAQNTWVVAATLQVSDGTATNWCVDSAGKSVGMTAEQYGAITSATTLCP